MNVSHRPRVLPRPGYSSPPLLLLIGKNAANFQEPLRSFLIVKHQEFLLVGCHSVYFIKATGFHFPVQANERVYASSGQVSGSICHALRLLAGRRFEKNLRAV